jgi:hypothetical protein
VEGWFRELAVRYVGFRDAPADGRPEAPIVLDDHGDLPAALRI